MTRDRRVRDVRRGRMTIDVLCDNHAEPPTLRSFPMLGLEREPGARDLMWTAPALALMGDRRVVDQAGSILDDLDKSDPRTVNAHTSMTFTCSCGRPPLTVRTDRLAAVLATLAKAGRGEVTVTGLRSVLAPRKK